MHAEVRKKRLFPRLLADRFSFEGHRLWKARRISELENYFFGHHTPRIRFSSTLNIHIIGKIYMEERNFCLRIHTEVYLKIDDLLKYLLSNSDF